MNSFEITPLVRVDYSFPNVDHETRSKIYDVIFDREIEIIRGGGGDGSTNSGVMYIAPHELDALRKRLESLGLQEVS